MAEQSHRPQAGRRWFRLGTILLLSFAAAACQIVPRVEGPPPPPAEERAPQPVPSPPVRPDPPATPIPAADGTRHRVAVLVPLSGPNAGVGQSLANAANLALLDTGGERIRITAYDTAKGAAAAANEALADGNALFLGPLRADDVRAVAPVARRAEVPVIAFSNDVGVAGDGVYIMGFNPGQSIERVVEHARARGAQRFGALVPAGVYGQRASQAMIAAVERSGGRMVGMQSYERSAASVRGAAGRLAGQGEYDAVLVADGTRMAAVAAPIVRQGSPQARILGTELWAIEDEIDAALRGSWYAAASDAMFDQFASRYRGRYGANPYRLSSLGYDAVLLAVRVAADWRIGERFPEAAFRSRTGFTGLDGAFRFRPDGVAERALEVREVTAGGVNVVSPAPRVLD
jgi:branched-chain amino acid transport system substrate-binding protein